MPCLHSSQSILSAHMCIFITPTHWFLSFSYLLRPCFSAKSQFSENHTALCIKWVHLPLHHPERQLLWHPPIKTCCHCQSEGGSNGVLFSPLSGSIVQGSWDAVCLPSFPALLASETAWCSRAPGKYSGCWPQTSELNVNFHAFEINQATDSPELCVLPEYLPPGSKQPSTLPVVQKRAFELQVFTPLMHCLTKECSWQPLGCIRGLSEMPGGLTTKQEGKGDCWARQGSLQGTTALYLCLHQGCASDCNGAPRIEGSLHCCTLVGLRGCQHQLSVPFPMTRA